MGSIAEEAEYWKNYEHGYDTVRGLLEGGAPHEVLRDEIAIGRELFPEDYDYYHGCTRAYKRYRPGIISRIRRYYGW